METKPYVRPRVNINGTSREELIKQAFDVSGAAEALIQALGRAAPHGRDYQFAGRDVFTDAYKHDRKLWEKFVENARDIFDAYRNTGENLFLEGRK